MGGFNVGFPFVNTIVNPNNEDYLVPVLESRNYFSFSTDVGLSAYT